MKPAPAKLPTIGTAQYVDWVREARGRTLSLICDLSEPQLRVKKLPILNPMDWEAGHVAYFYERFLLRDRFDEAPHFEDADDLFDSIDIEHEVRWDLPIPPRPSVVTFLERSIERTVDRISEAAKDESSWYRALLAVFHEDMHCEALAYTRQTMAYPAPCFAADSKGAPDSSTSGPEPRGDAEIPAGQFRLGARRDQGFVLDNEQWEHPREVSAFAISKTAVTQAQFAEFVDAGGYQREDLWTPEGWDWRESVQAQHPVYWRQTAAGWQRRRFDRWVDLEDDLPVMHVNWFEAKAFCRFTGRRLPTELEWEVAASAEPESGSRLLARRKRLFPWGDQPAEPGRSNLDFDHCGPVSVFAFPESDSAFGCRQMLGNVWEWCEDTFGPYPGFEPGPYREYSRSLFGSTKVLRGGGWATTSRMIRNTWRNYLGPERSDIFAGFRTVAL